MLSGQPVQRSWGIWAAVGYGLAALAVVIWKIVLGARSAITIAVAGALACPLIWQVTGGRTMSQVGEGALQVVSRAGMLLLRHGSPYLPTTQLQTPISYNPYEPGLAIFGLPHAFGLAGWLANPRLWFAGSGAVLVFLAFRRLTGHAALTLTAFAFSSPVIALPVILGGTDVPVLGLLLLAAALLDEPSRPGWAGVALGVSCALKATAWPAFLVFVALVAARDGRLRAARFTAAVFATTSAVVIATAPAALIDPGSMLRNTVLFPLGLTHRDSTAASPLPGHLLAATGLAGHWIVMGLLIVVVFSLGVSLIARPPDSISSGLHRLAAFYILIFVVAPASRWGYFVYPIALYAWTPLIARTRGSCDSVPAAGTASQMPVFPDIETRQG